MPNQYQNLCSNPFDGAWWRAAGEDLKRPRTLAFAALMIAACVALAQVPSIPLTGHVNVTWGFLARSVCGMVCGPVTALVFGAAEDTISYLLHPSGAYFPGYMVTTMVGTFLYTLFLYRQRVTVWKVFLAKLATNVLNVVLGALWSSILYGKGYLFEMWRSLIGNAVKLIPQTVLLCVFFSALLPVLAKLGLIPSKMGRLEWI